MSKFFGLRYNQSYKKWMSSSMNKKWGQTFLQEKFDPLFFEDQRKGYQLGTEHTRDIAGLFDIQEEIERLQYGPKVNIQPDRLLELYNKKFDISAKVPVKNADGSLYKDSNNNIVYEDVVVTKSINDIMLDLNKNLSDISKINLQSLQERRKIDLMNVQMKEADILLKNLEVQLNPDIDENVKQNLNQITGGIKMIINSLSNIQLYNPDEKPDETKIDLDALQIQIDSLKDSIDNLIVAKVPQGAVAQQIKQPPAVIDPKVFYPQLLDLEEMKDPADEKALVGFYENVLTYKNPNDDPSLKLSDGDDLLASDIIEKSRLFSALIVEKNPQNRYIFSSDIRKKVGNDQQIFTYLVNLLLRAGVNNIINRNDINYSVRFQNFKFFDDHFVKNNVPIKIYANGNIQILKRKPGDVDPKL